MKILCFFTILALLLPTVASSNNTLECYKKNINLGNSSFDNKKYNESIKYYKNSYNCSLNKKEKIISLASLVTAEYKIGNNETSKIYLEKLLSIAPRNKWAKKFLEDNKINSLKENKIALSSYKGVNNNTSLIKNNDTLKVLSLNYTGGNNYKCSKYVCVSLNKNKLAMSYQGKLQYTGAGVLSGSVYNAWKGIALIANDFKDSNIDEYYPVVTTSMEKMYVESLSIPYFSMKSFN